MIYNSEPRGMRIPNRTKEEWEKLITPEMIEEFQEQLFGDYYLPPEPHQLRKWGYEDV